MTEDPGTSSTDDYGVAVLTLAGQIRNEIESGAYPHGRQLPTTTELSKTWSVSNTTVSRAMRLLEKEGLVISKPRSGRIANHPPETPAPAPVVLLIGGYAGSGKTQLGRIIAGYTHWPILDKDSTTRAVVEATLKALGSSPNDRESEIYKKVIRPAEYVALMTAVMENVECGNSVVATAPFVTELADAAWCEEVSGRIEALGGHMEVAWVRCDADSMRRYIQYRGAGRDSAKLEDWDSYLSGIDLAYTPVVEHHVIDNNAALRSLHQQSEQLLARITA